MSAPDPTPAEARGAMADHVAFKGAQIREKYGPAIGWAELQRLVADPEFVRYPCQVAFAAERLLPNEPAYAAPVGDRPEDGYIIAIHPYFALDPSRVPYLALYQLVVVNYGPFASSDDAEVFGAAALGLDRETYYETLCALADEMGGMDAPPACSCGQPG
jgi:hypothetical protein